MREHVRAMTENGRKDVLGSLPRTRPARRSAKRDAGAGRKAAAAEAATPKARQAPARPAPAAKAAAPAAARPRAAAKRTAAVPPPKSAAPKRQKPLRAAPPPPPPPAGWAAPADEASPLSAPELVTSAIQAVGELAQIGATFGLQAARHALSRLPRP